MSYYTRGDDGCAVVLVIGLMLLWGALFISPSPRAARLKNQNYAKNKITEILAFPKENVTLKLPNKIPDDVLIPGNVQVMDNIVSGPKADVAYLISSMYELGPSEMEKSR